MNKYVVTLTDRKKVRTVEAQHFEDAIRTVVGKRFIHARLNSTTQDRRLRNYEVAVQTGPKVGGATPFANIRASIFKWRAPSRQWNETLDARMQAAWEKRNAQAAANIIGEAQTSIEEQNAMDAARKAGFVPEYYADSIRVHLTREGDTRA